MLASVDLMSSNALTNTDVNFVLLPPITKLFSHPGGGLNCCRSYLICYYVSSDIDRVSGNGWEDVHLVKDIGKGKTGLMGYKTDSHCL